MRIINKNKINFNSDNNGRLIMLKIVVKWIYYKNIFYNNKH